MVKFDKLKNFLFRKFKTWFYTMDMNVGITWRTSNISNSRNLIRKNSLPVTLKKKNKSAKQHFKFIKIQIARNNTTDETNIFSLACTKFLLPTTTIRKVQYIGTLNIIQRKEQRKIRKSTTLNTVKSHNVRGHCLQENPQRWDTH